LIMSLLDEATAVNVVATATNSIKSGRFIAAQTLQELQGMGPFNITWNATAIVFKDPPCCMFYYSILQK
jgi:hypothetical protein